MFRNLIITQTVLHELEHAYQSKISDDASKVDIESKIIRNLKLGASIY